MKIFIKLPPHIKFCFKLGMEIFGRTQKGYLHFNSQGSMIYFQWNYLNQNMLSEHNFIFQACSFYPLFFFVTHQINPNPNPAQHPFVASFLAHVLFLTNMKHIYVYKSEFLNFFMTGQRWLKSILTASLQKFQIVTFFGTPCMWWTKFNRNFPL